MSIIWKELKNIIILAEYQIGYNLQDSLFNF